MWRRATAVLLLTSVVLLSGCTHRVLARKLVQAPNQSGMAQSGLKAMDFKKDFSPWSSTWRLPVGPPDAELQVAVIEPADYKLKHELKIKPTATAGRSNLTLDMKWDLTAAGKARNPAKGTVVLLHGVYVSKEAMLHWAMYLAQAGYRVVLVDLRGHGQSTGDWITFGAIETRDLGLLLDDLQRRGLAGRRVGVLGISYGASLGLLLAAKDNRVATVVALQPFSDVRRAIPPFVRANFGPMAKGITDEDFSVATRRAAKLAGFSWAETDVVRAVSMSTVPILIFHGAQDTWISPDQSRELIKHAPAGSKFGLRSNDTHVTLAVRLDPIANEVVAWFDQHLP